MKQISGTTRTWYGHNRQQNPCKMAALYRKIQKPYQQKMNYEYICALEKVKKMSTGRKANLPQLGFIIFLKNEYKNNVQWKTRRTRKHIEEINGVGRGFGICLGNGYFVQRPLQLVCDL